MEFHLTADCTSHWSPDSNADVSAECSSYQAKTDLVSHVRSALDTAFLGISILT